METTGLNHPPLWFDTAKHPSLDLWFVVIPAYVIPVTISLLLPPCQRLRRKVKESQTNIDYDPPHLPHIPEKKANHNNIPIDLETNSTTTASRPNRQTQIFQFAVLVYHQTQTITRILYLSTLTSDFDGGKTTLCLSQAAIILFTSYAFHLDLISCILTAIGWLLFAVQTPPGPGLAVVIAMLALPYAFQKPLLRGRAILPGGSFLLILLCNTFLPKTSIVRSPRIYTFQLWPATIPLVLDFAEKLYNYRTHLSKSDDRSQHGLPDFIMYMKSELVFDFAASAFCIAAVIVVLLPIAVFFIITSYSFSCLGWWWLFSKRAAEPPIITGGFMAGFVFLAVYSFFVWREGSRPVSLSAGVVTVVADQVLLNAFAACWTVAGFTCLWLGWTGLEWVGGFFEGA